MEKIICFILPELDLASYPQMLTDLFCFLVEHE